MHIKTMAEFAAEGRDPEVLFWVGCLGSYDARAQRVSAAFAQILDNIGIEFAILGKEESCTGDPARRAGNEFIFQMLANQNIQTLTNYGVKKLLPPVLIVLIYLKMNIRNLGQRLKCSTIHSS